MALVRVICFLLAAVCSVLAQPAFPLHTSSRWIVDSNNKRVKLACTNWYGAHLETYVVNGLSVQPVDSIAQLIARLGFNCVRLTFSVEMYVKNPVITNMTLVAANPSFHNRTAMEIFDATVDSLGRAGVMIVLNNHISDAGWCCSEQDGNGLWYTKTYPESVWMSMWVEFARRYASNKWVVAADLRNELRASNLGVPTWGSGSSATDWHAAATRAGNAVLAVNPNWLIIVEGLNYATQLRDVYNSPVVLYTPNRVVYSAHDYSWSQPDLSYADFQKLMGDEWGYIVSQNHSFTAPLWLGEFGTNSQSAWWTNIRQYLQGADFEWGYWSIDGYKYIGQDETFGILNADYKTLSQQWKLDDLQAIQKCHQNC
eukprot:TRINITY_DN5705_c0_g1_i1.p1 TRINITY_DN5705_c0_g1~~TRINITY_DN5705_c0_g1_i1.p1  ORF type:complete len:370 (+),score=62.63 TRINITY_DN5705_c0_g1_i1:1105-2214(+)